MFNIILNKNKKQVGKLRRQVLHLHFEENKKIIFIARELGFNLEYLEWFFNESRGTKTYTYNSWEEIRRCTSCKVYKSNDRYKNHWNYLNSICDHCNKLKRRNDSIITRNTWIRSKEAIRKKNIWEKYKWRYNTRRTVLRIIKYTDRNWKIIKL